MFIQNRIRESGSGKNGTGSATHKILDPFCLFGPCRARVVAASDLGQEPAAGGHHLRQLPGRPEGLHQAEAGAVQAVLRLHHEEQSQPRHRLRNHAQHEGVRGERREDRDPRRGVHEASTQPYQAPPVPVPRCAKVLYQNIQNIQCIRGKGKKFVVIK